ncbi:hypothetical protein F4820DRAFT_384488 [Hypoxylon rubiginosum]|uniref:Uncharacterized protein n=1 Tax=Hypoxylon rubiginosum TaxID=110542 RepID=A0ACB9ZD07_9PEZI|nr:hypothetical protein F4820DRAFT_384488 [Hypoxylon rubiginosum]
MEVSSLLQPAEMPTKPSLRCSLQSIHDDEKECDEQRLTKKWQSKAIALCKDLWPSAKHNTLSVKYLSHGSYNTVFSLSMVMTDGQPVEYVLRIPDAELPIPRTAAILEYLNEFTDLKVPRVITWDATANNSLENSYIILSRIPGKCLQDVWEDLTHDQKLRLAQELAQQFLQIESVTNSSAGAIKVHEKGFRHGDEVSERIFVEALATDIWEAPGNPINWFNGDNGLLPLERLRHDPPNLNVNDIMLAIFKRRIYQAKNYTDPQDCYLDTYELCQDVVEDMVKLGIFESESDAICLHHTDLFPRNIMVDFSPDITITGVLDWDVTLFAPRFAGRAPPRWLWQSTPQDESEYAKFDMEPLDPNDNEPDSPENAEIKIAFEAAVGEKWLSESTEKWYPFARRLLRFGRQNIYDEDVSNLLMWTRKWISVIGEESDASDVESLSTEELDDSEDGETDEDDGVFSNQGDEDPLMSGEGPATSSTAPQENLEHEEQPTNIKILEYDSLEYSSSCDSKNQETGHSIEKDPIEERWDAEAMIRRAWDCFRSLLVNPPDEEIQMPRHVDSSIKNIQDWLESQSVASLDKKHSEREPSIRHVRDWLEGTQKRPDSSMSATTAKEEDKFTVTIAKLTPKADDNESRMGAILDWAVSSPRTSLEVGPAVPEIPATTTRQHENPKGDSESSWSLGGRKVVLEGPWLCIFLSFIIVQLALTLALGIWLLAHGCWDR